MNSKVIQRLIWKDRRSLMPLIIAVVLGVIGFNIMVVVVAEMNRMPTNDQIAFAIAVSILLPVLFAYGAPAMLVGGEHESGSLAWLKTLPVSWRAIVGSKLMVAMLGLFTVLALSSIFLTLHYLALDSSKQSDNIQSLPTLLIATCFFCTLLLLLSFVSAYLFRSPITALLLVVPMAVGVFLAFMYALIKMENLFRVLLVAGLTERELNLLAAGVGFVLLLLIYAVHQWVAFRRLTKPESGSPRKLINTVTTPNAYQPPEYFTQSWYGVSLSQERATPFGALLWQHFRQSGGWLIALTLVGVVAALLVPITTNQLEPLPVSVVSFCLFFIASLTFYGDSVRGRCRFFFDRGISRGLIWITRILGSLIPTLLVLSAGCAAAVVSQWMQGFQNGPVFTRMLVDVLSVVAFGYAITQLVSQWAPRPALAFFAAPVFVTLAAFALGSLLVYYQAAIPVLLLSAAILFFASWYLTPAWMNGREMEKKHGYNIVFITALAVSFALPWVLVLGTRYVTMPNERTQWKADLLSATEPRIPTAEVSEIRDAAFAGTLEGIASAPRYVDGDLDTWLEKELGSNKIVGEYVTMHDLVRVLATGDGPRASKISPEEFIKRIGTGNIPVLELSNAESNDFQTIQILTKWSNEVRQGIVAGQTSYRALFGIAENSDWMTTGILIASLKQNEPSPELRQLIDALPSQDLIRQSRLAGLKQSYQWFDKQGGDFLGSYRFGQLAPWLMIERMRSKRFVDELMFEIVEQLESGKSLDDPSFLDRVRQLQNQASLKAYMDYRSYGTLPGLTDQFEKMAQTDRWRAKLD